MRKRNIFILLLVLVCCGALLLTFFWKGSASKHPTVVQSDVFTDQVAKTEARDSVVVDMTSSPKPSPEEIEDIPEMEIVDEVVIEIEPGKAVAGG